MIEKFQGYRVGQQFFATIVDAQKHELALLLGVKADDPPAAQQLIETILKGAAEIVNVLTMTPRSLPKARKINGGTKKRRHAPFPPMPGAVETAA